MALTQITYTDKVENNGATDDGKVLATDMNEIKSVVNSNATDFDTNLAGTSNVTAFTPSADYHPATKKYVDDSGPVAVIQDQKASGTNGGTSTSGAWQTRDLNTITSDDDSIVSLSSNQFTLQDGKYRIEASTPALKVDRHQAKLYNITDSTDELIGSSEFTNAVDTTGNRSFIDGIITIASAKTFEIQHQCQTTQVSNGLGISSNFGVTEVYTQVTITKLG